MGTLGGIARQQWRARIETAKSHAPTTPTGRIARQQWRARIETSSRRALRDSGTASPASNGGRGLKLVGAQQLRKAQVHRPPAMAGAD